MEKLVLTITNSDDCTYSYDSYVCFSYESKEKAIVDFGSDLLVKIEQVKKHKKEHKEIMRQIDELRPKINNTNDREKKDIIIKKIKDLHSKNIDIDPSFLFAKKEFNVFDFYIQEYNEKKSDLIREPLIQTLEEWFNSN